MRSLLVALTFALALALWQRPAQAESNKLQVLTIVSPDAFENAKALTIALKRAVTRADGWSLAPGDFSMEVLMAGFNCNEPPDDACLAKVAESVGTNRYIWGTLSQRGSEVSAHLRFWENGRNVRETKVTYAANLTDASDDTLLQIAEDAFHQLLGVSEGTLVVLAGSTTGDVFVNGRPEGRIIDGRAELLVGAGKVEVVVRAPGYLDAKGQVAVRPGVKAELVLDLVPVADPGAAEQPPERARRKPKRATEQTGTSAQKVAGYGAIGAGAVVGILGGVFWVQSAGQKDDKDYEEYRAEVRREDDPCKQAKVDGRDDIVDLCDKNKTTRTLAWILTPTGVAIAGVGAVLLLTDAPRQERVERRIRPSLALGPEGGRLDLQVRF